MDAERADAAPLGAPSGGGTAAALGSYLAARLLTLAEPLRPREERQAARAAAALQRYLGLAPAAAAEQGRRGVLLRRDRLFHDLLLLRGEPAGLLAVLEQATVEGIDRLAALPAERGVLFLTLHYSLYTSLLWQWLARETGRGRFRHFTSLMIASPAGGPDWIARRTAELASAGLLVPGTFTVLDRKAAGERAVARALAASLAAAGAALVAPDVGFLPADDPRAISLQLGRERIGLPRGAAWLAATSGCAVVPVYVRPAAEHGHAIHIGRPRLPARSAARPAVQDALQELLDRAVGGDPAPWEEWSRVEWATADLPERQMPPSRVGSKPSKLGSARHC